VTAVWLLATTVGTVSPPAVGAQSRRLVVVGDSVILGARSGVESSFGRMGWATTFDAAVNRSTLAGVTAVRSHAAELTDTLVVNLGANDAAETATFRQRVDSVMSAAATVPHVYWLTIREVRPYYGPANQVLRDAAAAYPNLEVIDWNGATAGSRGLTAGDGLHLTPAGANSMAFLVAASVVAGAPPADPGAVTAVPAPVPAVVAADPAAGFTTVPDAAADPTSAPATTVVTAPDPSSPATIPPGTSRPGANSGDSAARALVEDGGSGLGAIGWSLGIGLAAMVAILALAGVWIAGWALFRTRGTASPPPDAAPAMSARSKLRAERIAAARSHHPTSALPPAALPPERPTEPPRTSSATASQT